MATSQQMPIEPGYERYVEPLRDEEVELPQDDLLDALGAGKTRGTELEDGSYEVAVEEEVSDPASSREFFANLADDLPEAELSAMSLELRTLVEQDKEDREPRDKQYAEGIRRTGLGVDPVNSGAAFSGGSEVVHPMLVEGCIDFAARAMKELFPPKGPVRTQIIGEATTEKVERANRKKTYMNWQLTRQIREYRDEQEQMLTQVPLGGSQYMKVWHSDDKRRITAEFVPIDDIFLPYAAASFESAERKTHRQFLTKTKLEARVASGLYRDIEVKPDSMSPDRSAASAISAKIEGKDDSSLNQDGETEVYEVATNWDFGGEDSFAEEGRAAPYIITIEKTTGRVLAVYRNWAEKDEAKQELDWIVEFGLIPWRGAYKIGLAHIIGSLSSGATGAVRALLDSAHINNFPGGLKLKGNKTAGQNTMSEPTQLTEIEGPTQIDDIRKLAMPFPFNPPSTVLFSLLEWMTAAGKGVIATAEEKIADVSSTAPVGTTLAMIEQGSITFSSIHARLHASQARVLAIIHRLNAIYLEDEETVEELGELVVSRRDFEGPMDVVPVSDPNIFSDTQRYAQNAEVGKLVATFPQLFKIERYVERTMQLLNYPEYSEILNAPAEARELDPIDENYQATKQDTQLKAYEGQDHLEHLKAHLIFALSPVMCNNPFMAVPAMPTLLNHCREHLLLLYQNHARAAAKMAEALGRASDEPAMVEGSMAADQQLAMDLAPIMPMLEQLFQAVQQYSPKPPADPNIAKTQMEIEYKTKKDEADRQATQAETMQAMQAKLAETQQKLQAEGVRHTEEMAAANSNAQIAAQAEQQRTQLQAFLAQLKEQSASDRQTQAEAMQLRLEAMRENSAKEIEILRGAIATNQQAAQAQAQQMSQVLQGILDKMDKVEDRRVQVGESRAQREHELVREGVKLGVKRDGKGDVESLQAKTPQPGFKGFRVKRKPNGDLEGLEVLH